MAVLSPISFISAKDLLKETMRKGALVTIPNLIDFFSIPGSPLSDWEVWFSILRDAVRDFDHHYPLVIEENTYIEIDNNFCSIMYTKDNFEDFVKSKEDSEATEINEKDLFLVPETVVEVYPGNMYGGVCYMYPMRDFRYRDGVFYDFVYGSGTYNMKAICNHPVYEYYNEDGTPTKNSGVWFMNKKQGTPYNLFLKQLYYETCRFLLTEKKNMALTNLPIEIFQGIEEDYQNVKSELENYYQGLTSSTWLI